MRAREKRRDQLVDLSAIMFFHPSAKQIDGSRRAICLVRAVKADRKAMHFRALMINRPRIAVF